MIISAPLLDFIVPPVHYKSSYSYDWAANDLSWIDQITLSSSLVYNYMIIIMIITCTATETYCEGTHVYVPVTTLF